MSDGLTINLDRHLEAFTRMAAQSKKTLPELWKQEAKLCLGGTASMPGVAGITPPYSAGAAGQNARMAQKHAEAKIFSDIHSLYGTPADAYEALKAQAPAKATSFWFLHLHDDNQAAHQILRGATGKSFSPFDDGKLHQSNFRFTQLRRKRAKQGRAFSVVYYVNDEASLNEYIKAEQEHVWWLASGWAEPLRALGARLPIGVKKLPAPGHLRVIANEQRIEITASNDVKFSRQIADMERRIQTVFNDYRVQRLDRMWENYLAKLARETGLKKV